jgi:hypothetical protein
LHEPGIQLWWLREPVRGRPEADLGRSVTPRELQDLLEGAGEVGANAAAFAAAIEFASRRHGCSRVVLPAMDAVEWKQRAAAFERLRLAPCGGFLLPGATAQAQLEALACLAGGSRWATAGDPAIAAWSRVPDESDWSYFRVMASVSRRVQALLRERVAEQVMNQPDAIRDPALVLPLLAYQVSKPFPGRQRTEFTYDILARDTVAKLCWTIRGPFRQSLERMQLRAMAISADLAAQYEPSGVTRTLSKIARERQLVNSLLTIDHYVVEELVRFASLSPGFTTVHAVQTASARLARGVCMALHRGYVGNDFSALAPELFLAACEQLRDAIEEESNAPQPGPVRPAVNLPLAA